MPGGVKNWASGQTLDAADLNEYIANQVIARFPTIAARTAAYGVPGAPSLQAGLFAYVESTEKLYYYDGTTWDEINELNDNEVTTARLVDGAVTSDKILDGTILNVDISASAAIDKTKIAGTAITAADTGTVTNTIIADGAVTSAKILDGTIVNADINAAAAIDKTKIDGTAVTIADIETITGTMIKNDAVALGTKTTGNYVASLVAGTGVTLTNNSGEGATPTVAIGQAVGTTSEVTFLGVKQTSVIESITISATAATGSIPIDVANGTTFYTVNATGNFVINLRWNSSTTLNTKLAIGEMATTSFLVTNGSTPYYPTSVQVNGTVSGVTTRWQGATGAPTGGNANSTDMYTVTAIKTAANTWTVFAAQTRFS